MKGHTKGNSRFVVIAVSFSVICLVPFVPGSGLYYTMTSAFAGDLEGLLHNGSNTLALAAALSFGVVIVNTSVVYIKKHFFRKKKSGIAAE